MAIALPSGFFHNIHAERSSGTLAWKPSSPTPVLTLQAAAAFLKTCTLRSGRDSSIVHFLEVSIPATTCIYPVNIFYVFLLLRPCNLRRPCLSRRCGSPTPIGRPWIRRLNVQWTTWSSNRAWQARQERRINSMYSVTQQCFAMKRDHCCQVQL